MNVSYTSQESEIVTQHNTFDDKEVFVADLGSATDARVNIVDSTAIITYEDGGPQQVEVQLPDGDAEATVTNGILTIEVEQ